MSLVKDSQEEGKQEGCEAEDLGTLWASTLSYELWG